jgi:hypothetical protein
VHEFCCWLVQGAPRLEGSIRGKGLVVALGMPPALDTPLVRAAPP